MLKHAAYYSQQLERIANALRIVGAERKDDIRLGRTLQHSLTFFVLYRESPFLGAFYWETGVRVLGSCPRAGPHRS